MPKETPPAGVTRIAQEKDIFEYHHKDQYLDNYKVKTYKYIVCTHCERHSKA